MSTHYDEKGKIFTNVVTKQSIPVVIQTTTHRVEGVFHARPDDRLKDELNQGDRFIAITQAVIFGEDGSELYRVSFMAVNRDNIVWMMPAKAFGD